MKVKHFNQKEHDAHLESLELPLNAKFVTECKNDPSLFMKHMLGIPPYTWQKLILDDIKSGNKRLIVDTSRQIGKTTLCAAVSLWVCWCNKARSGIGKNTKVGIFSRSDDQAKKIIYEIRNLITNGDIRMRKFSRSPNDRYAQGYFKTLIDYSQKAESTKEAITFKQGIAHSKVGSFIKSYPPTDAGLGNFFDYVFVDEASRLDDDIFYRVISPTMDKYNATTLLTSTPAGLSGFFFEMFDPFDDDDKHEYKRHYYDIKSIIHDDPEQHRAVMNKVEDWIRKGKRLLAEQEYFGKFTSNDQSFFEFDDVENMYDKGLVQMMSCSEECDMGVDFGGAKTSRTVITISKLDSDGIITRLFDKVYPVKGDDSLITDMVDLKKRFNIQRIIVDQCPEGDYAIREMKNRGWNITGFVFAREKLSKYGSFRAKLHQGQIKSYKDDELAIEMRALNQLQGVQRTMIKAPKGYGDDIIDSFLMSVYFYIDEEGNFEPIDWNDTKWEIKKAETDELTKKSLLPGLWSEKNL